MYLLKKIFRFFRKLRATNFKGVDSGINLAIAPGVKIYPSKFVKIGNNVMIGRDVIISTSKSGSSPVFIGDDVMIAHRSLIIGGNHKYTRTDIPMNKQGEGVQGAINIESDVWIGAGCIVLTGVTIGEGSIVGSGSIVSKDIPKYSIAVGSPAKVINKRKNEIVSSE